MATLPAGRARIGCATWTVFSVATAKPAATAVKASAIGKRDRPPPRDECDGAAERSEARAGPPRRLAVGGEIDRDAEAERDRKPRQQAAGPGVGDRPVAETLGGGAAEIGKTCPAQASARARRSAASHVPTRPRLLWPLPQSAMRNAPRALTLSKHDPAGIVPRKVSFAADLLGECITQSDGAIEHRAVGRRIRIADEIALPLELHRLGGVARRPPAPARRGRRSRLPATAD